MENTITTTGADVKRGLALMSAQAYDKLPAETIGKEALQNALDAIDSGGVKRIEVGSNGTVFRLRDFGPGMSPKEVITTYLRGFVSGKDGSQTRGAFGLAKIALLAAPQRFQIRAVKSGIQTVVKGTQGQWLDYAQADKIEVSPTPGVQSLPGGLILEISETTIPEGFTYWCEVPNAYRAEATVKRALKQLRDPDIEFAGTDADFGADGAAGDTEQPDCVSRSALLEIRREETVPGAVVRMFYDPEQPLSPAVYIPISSQGLVQFTESVWGLDAALPADISFDVQPTVGTDSADYPYSLNRDALKGPAKIAVLRWLKQLAEEAKAVESKKLRGIIDQAARLKGSHLKFLDMTGRLPADLVREITNSAPLADYARAVNKAYTDITAELGEQYAAVEFQGVAFGGGWLGVKCGDAIWFDPFAIQAETLPHPEVAAGAFVHELAHCDSACEGETHARAMTFLAGRVSEQTSNLKRALRRLFERQSGFAEWLASVAERGNEFRDRSAVDALLKILAKNG